MSKTLSNTKLWEVVLTGQKLDTGLSYLQQKLMDRGYRVFTVLHDGLMIDDQDLALAWISHKLRMQRNLRHSWRKLAEDLIKEDGIPTVILYQGAELDILQGQSSQMIEKALLDINLSLREVRDTYDLLIYFQKDEAVNNSSLWNGHPHLRPIMQKYGEDFYESLDRALTAMNALIGYPAYEYERKFLLNNMPDESVLDKAQAIEITQTYLLSSQDDIEIRVRKRSQGPYHTYYRTQKKWIGQGAREEEDEIISYAQYQEYLMQADPTRQKILKTRYCLLEPGHYLELDKFHTPNDIILLEIETDTPDGAIHLPDWVQALDPIDVTADPRYHNYSIAKLR